MSHSKEINETSIKQLQITHVELKLYSDACSEPTNCVASNHANYKSSYVGYYTKAEIQVLQQSQRFPHHPGRPFGRREPRSPPYSQIMFSPSASPKVLLQRTPMSVLVKKKGLFSCWRRTHPNAFPVGDDSICAGICIRNHNARPTSGINF
jgi:hypothetical protein